MSKIKLLYKCVTSILEFQVFVIVKVDPFQSHEIQQAFVSSYRMTLIFFLLLSDVQALSAKSLKANHLWFQRLDLWPLTPKQWWDVNWTCLVWAMMKRSMCSEWYRETCISVRRKRKGSGNSTRECETSVKISFYFNSPGSSEASFIENGENVVIICSYAILWCLKMCCGMFDVLQSAMM